MLFGFIQKILTPSALCIFSERSFKRIEQHPARVGSLPSGAALCHWSFSGKAAVFRSFAAEPFSFAA